MTQEIKKLKIFIPKEIEVQEKRTSITPVLVKKLLEKNFEIIIEKDAGEGSMISDQDFIDAGASLVDINENNYKEANLILGLNAPQNVPTLNKHQIEMMSPGACWISGFTPQSEEESIQKMKNKNVVGFSLNLMPRITRAQNMDILSSQSNLAGYKAVIIAANELLKVFPLMMTAAGTINPVKVVVMGAGVAGLQAIATAKRLGAQVEASDIRLAAKEQVESLGAKFIEVDNSEDMEDEKGYAKEASPEFLKKQAEEVAKRVAQADVVITTALIPGRKAPVLITEEMVKSMQKGSVIVDMAAIAGGNCALSKVGERVEKYGVKIIGDTDITSQVAINATQVYAKNLENFINELVKDNNIDVDSDNEVIKNCRVS